MPDGHLRQAAAHHGRGDGALLPHGHGGGLRSPGSLGTQGHFANGLAALYLACGQDVACVAESALGHTLIERLPGGNLLCSVTLPGLMVGTVGGGTGLPGPAACLDILGLRGGGGADRLAEVAAALCLAGELSITGAICAGEFTRAHSVHGPGRGGAMKANRWWVYQRERFPWGGTRCSRGPCASG